MAASQSHEDGSVLTAELKSRKSRGGHAVTNWRTHFWVVDVAERRIKVFKDDQALKPKKIIHAQDISNVSVGSDKHNKFFHLSLRLRDETEIALKMQSREMRDRWLTAAMEMLRNLRNDDRIQSAMSVVRQLTAEWTREFEIDIEANIGQLAGLQIEHYANYINGLVAGAELIRRVVPVLPTHLPSVGVSTIRLAVFLHDAPLPTISQMRDTRYDPAARFLHVAVHGGFDPTTGAYGYKTVDAHAIMSMVGSTVWRNPELEEFLREGSAARAEADRIAKLLGVPHFDISLQWGHDLDDSHDSSKVQQYVDTFVNSKLIADIHRVFQGVIQADANASQVFAATSIIPSFQESVAIEMLPPACRPMTAAENLSRFVSGVGIMIDAHAVEAQRMPAIAIRHSMWKDDYLGPAFTLTSRRRAAAQQNGTGNREPSTVFDAPAGMSFEAKGAREGREDPLSSLAIQLQDVILHVRIAEACRAMEVACGAEFQLKHGCVCAWDALITAVVACAPSIPEQRITQLVADVASLYLRRMQGLAKKLNAAGLLESIQGALKGWRINFVQAPAAANMSTSFNPQRLPHPFVENGELVDTMILIAGHQVPPPSLSVQHSLECAPGLRASFALPELYPWFLGFASVPSNLQPYQDSDAELDNDDDRDSDEDVEFGNMVAIGRKFEALILTDENLASQLYDSQPVAPDLKANTKTITAGIDAIRRAFPTNVISNHDLMRVISLTLAKVRALVTNYPSITYRGSRFLQRRHGVEVLQRYCEYSQSKSLVEAALHSASINLHTGITMARLDEVNRQGEREPFAGVSVAGVAGGNAGSPKNPQAGTSAVTPPPLDDGGDNAAAASRSAEELPPVGAVPFQHIAWAILCHLMPAEAVLAMNSRYDLLLVGLANTGKSLLINSLKGLHHTTEANVGVQTTIVPFGEWVFGMKELGGRLEVRKNFKHHIKIMGKVNGVVVCVDAAQQRSLGEARTFIYEVLNHQALRGLPVLLIANTAATENSLKPPELAKELDFDRLCTGAGHVWKAVACHITLPQHQSDSERELRDGLQWLCQKLQENAQQQQQQQQQQQTPPQQSSQRTATSPPPPSTAPGESTEGGATSRSQANARMSTGTLPPGNE